MKNNELPPFPGLRPPAGVPWQTARTPRPRSRSKSSSSSFSFSSSIPFRGQKTDRLRLRGRFGCGFAALGISRFITRKNCQRPPAKPEACRRRSGSKPLSSFARWLGVRSLGVIRISVHAASHAIGCCNQRRYIASHVPACFSRADRSPRPIPVGQALVLCRDIFPELSNSGSLPGKAGGSPIHLDETHFVSV